MIKKIEPLEEYEEELDEDDEIDFLIEKMENKKKEATRGKFYGI